MLTLEKSSFSTSHHQPHHLAAAFCNRGPHLKNRPLSANCKHYWMDHRTQTPPQRTLTIELGDLGAQNVLDDWKSKVLETLFDLPPDIIASYPGISAYCQDLESRFEALNVPLYESGWAQIRHQYTQAVTSCWPRFYAVLLVLREASNDQTMGSIWEQLRERNLAPTERERYTGERYEFFIPFAVICWATSWLDPLIPETKQEEPAYFCQGEPDTPGQPLRFSFFREAIGIFQTFKPSIWEETYDAMDMISYDSENLYEFVLNYHSLWENGNIRIKWVNALGQHLHFDPVKRQLSFFKFPSFCALKAIRGSSDTNGNFLERYVCQVCLKVSEGSSANSILG